MMINLLLDMDEVIAGFVAAACTVHDPYRGDGFYARVLACWEPGVWDCVPPISEASGRPRTGEGALTPEGFWCAIHTRGEPFWVETVRPLPWAREVAELATELAGDDWCVVTSPSRCPTSYSGKAKWLRNFFGSGFDLNRRYLPTGRKELLAHVPSAVLIDDSDRNVDAFRAAGGQAILFPRHHNRAHPQKADPVGYLRQKLTYLVQDPAHHVTLA